MNRCVKRQETKRRVNESECWNREVQTWLKAESPARLYLHASLPPVLSLSTIFHLPFCLICSSFTSTHSLDALLSVFSANHPLPSDLPALSPLLLCLHFHSILFTHSLRSLRKYLASVAASRRKGAASFPVSDSFPLASAHLIVTNTFDQIRATRGLYNILLQYITYYIQIYCSCHFICLLLRPCLFCSFTFFTTLLLLPHVCIARCNLRLV